MDLDRVNFSLGQEQEDKDSFASFVQHPNFALADCRFHENEAPPEPIQEGAEYQDTTTLLELFRMFPELKKRPLWAFNSRTRMNQLGWHHPVSGAWRYAFNTG
jgi:hypothetical protein